MDASVDSLSSTQVDSLSSTQFDSMSGTHQFHMDNAASTIASILSSLRQTKADLEAATEDIPDHPYEALKHHHCHKDAEPFEFHNIRIPDDFCPKKSHQALLDISEKHSNNFCTHLETLSLSGLQLHEHQHFGNGFASLSGNQFVVDKDKITNHFLFIDMIRSVPLEYVTANPKEFAQKVITKFIEIHQ